MLTRAPPGGAIWLVEKKMAADMIQSENIFNVSHTISSTPKQPDPKISELVKLSKNGKVLFIYNNCFFP